MWEYLFSYGTIGWVGGTAGLTGVILLLILLIMFTCSLPIVRRKGKFEIFYWSHKLFVIWYIVLILHGPHFWKWFIGPAVIYITERILRSKILKIIQYGRTYIEEVNLLPSKVSTKQSSMHHLYSRTCSFQLNTVCSILAVGIQAHDFTLLLYYLIGCSSLHYETKELHLSTRRLCLYSDTQYHTL